MRRERRMGRGRVAMVLVPMLVLGAAAAVLAARADEVRKPHNDYPTAARADYVIGCLAANSFKRELLEKCACEIDTIADDMTYEDYEKASTVMSMQQEGGPRAGLFRDSPIAREETERLHKAQADANIHCG